MIKNIYNLKILSFLLLILLIIPKFNDAKETLIYADDISYDECV